jgi:hypothetical protein
MSTLVPRFRPPAHIAIIGLRRALGPYTPTNPTEGGRTRGTRVLMGGGGGRRWGPRVLSPNKPDGEGGRNSARAGGWRLLERSLSLWPPTCRRASAALTSAKTSSGRVTGHRRSSCRISASVHRCRCNRSSAAIFGTGAAPPRMNYRHRRLCWAAETNVDYRNSLPPLARSHGPLGPTTRSTRRPRPHPSIRIG